MLFPGSWQPTNDDPSSYIKTPWGSLHLDLHMAGSSLVMERAQTYALANGPLLLVSNSARFSAALLLSQVHPELPESMRITASYAAMWRVRAEQPLADYAFSCRWTPDSKRLPGGPCSGEGLEAQEWSDGHTSLTLGTQDLAAMMAYQSRGGVAPQSWDQAAWSSRPEEVNVVEYLPDGFLVKPPSVEPGEVVQVQFVVAWAPEPEGDIASWYAVDLPPSQALSALS
jgi:hypothetical protein